MTTAQIKYVQSLSQQKYRKAYNSYLVEGNKNAKEWLLSHQKIQMITALPEWLEHNKSLILKHPESQIIPVTETELHRVSSLKTAQSVLLVVTKPTTQIIPGHLKDWSLYLEEIKDPGNLGTIIRIADWFGIQHIFHSEHCVEIYNPKVVQATMGSLLHVSLYESAPEVFLQKIIRKDYPLYAASLDGENLLPQKNKKFIPGILALGNESKGLSDLLQNHSKYKLKIEGKGKAESLNVAIAAGIFCAVLMQ